MRVYMLFTFSLAQKLTTDHDNVVWTLQYLLNIYNPPGQQQSFSGGHLFVGDVVIVLQYASERAMTPFQVCWESAVLLRSQLRLHEYTPVGVSICIRLLSAAPAALIHHIRSLSENSTDNRVLVGAVAVHT